MMPENRGTRRILITHRPFSNTVKMLKACGEVISPAENSFSRRQVLDYAADCDAVMAFMPDAVDSDFLGACPRLRIIACALKGFDNFDARACTEHGVWLTIVPDLLTAPTAELTVGLAIALARQVLAGDAHVRNGDFKGWEPRFYGAGLEGSTVGIIGMGAIGSAVAVRLAGFGCRLVYTDLERLREVDECALNLSWLPFDELLAGSDFLVLAVSLTPQTRHMIDAIALARIRPGAFLINPCRGSVVDERAVLDALESGRLGGYAADVFEMEDWALPDRPMQIPQGLIEHPRTLFTPHIGSAITNVRFRIEQRAAENIRQALAGERPQDAVNDMLGAQAGC
jgi:phosphonate dehydrogenase